MYKDKDKRRDKERDRQRRYRASKGVTSQKEAKGVTNKVAASPPVDEPRTDGTNQPRTSTTDKPTSDRPERTGVNLDALGLALAPNSIGGTKLIVKPKPERTAQGNIRVSKPGDSDYVPMCETTRAFIEGRDKRPESGKRGKDIKHFGDLPMDVQASIDRLSVVDGKINPTAKANRTAIAINYQNYQTDRFHSTGVAI